MHYRLSRLATLACLVCGGWASGPAAAGDAAPKVFRAGAYAANITPSTFPVSANGGKQDKLVTSVHDPLHARCLVLDDGTTRLALVVCDSCAIPRELLDEAKRLAERATGIPVKNILISATHTHTAVTVVEAFQSKPEVEYQGYLIEQIAKGLQRAVENLEPARIGWGVGQDPSQIFNRRWILKPGTVPSDPFDRTTDRVKTNPGAIPQNLMRPAGPVDPEVWVLSVQSQSGRPIALLANYALHFVGGVPPLSADYFGEFAQRIGQLLEAEDVRPPFVGIMSNGASGDVNNVNFAVPRPRRASFEQIQIVADSVAKAAHEACQKIEYRDWVSLAVAEREVELGVRLPKPEDVERAQEILTQATRPFTDDREVYAQETICLAKFPPVIHAKFQAIRVGELGIVSSPCETFCQTGLDIKAKSPLRCTFIIELANGYNGYLPTPEQHTLGGYEIWRARSSYLAVDAEPKIQATLLELLDEVTK